MGVIAEMARTKAVPKETVSRHEIADQMWRNVFGWQEDKERPQAQSRNANAWSASSIANKHSIIRFLKALRSDAPGGWSDDRWEQSRHFVGITYASIHRKCEQLAQAEFQVYKKDPNHPEGKRAVTEHDPPEGGRMCKPWDLVELLKRPNKDDSFGDVLYGIGQQMDLTGMALSWVIPNQLGIPFEIYSIPTALAMPQPVSLPEYPEGYYRIQPVYPYGPYSSFPSPTSAVGAPIDARWVLKVKYPHPYLRYDGWSPQTALNLQMDSVEAIDRARMYQMRSGVHPDAQLTFDEVEGMMPLPEDEIERLIAHVEQTYAGSENRGKLFINHIPGSKLEQFGQKPLDMDYPQGWEQLVSFVMGAGFGITKPAAGMIDSASYSTLFATLKQLHLLTLGPTCRRIAARMTAFLCPFFGDDLEIEIKCNRIDDHEVKQRNMGILSGTGSVTHNELRMALGEEPTEEDWGKERVGGQESGVGGQESAGMIQGVTETPDEGLTDTIEATPGNLGRGAMGPRKELYDAMLSFMRPSSTAEYRMKRAPLGTEGKTFYDRVMAAIRETNGHA